MTALTVRDVLGWKVATAGFDDAVPRVLDVELAEHLGYERPRDVRKLIERLAKTGKLPGVSSRATVAHQLVNGGATREFLVTEYWLTREQAIKVVAKSETETADSILDEVIRVFMAATSAPAALPDDARLMAMFERMLSPLVETVNSITKIISDMSGCRISDADCASLKRQVQLIAKMRAQGNINSKGENSERRIIYNKLGAAVAWTGSGRRWDGLPASRVAEVMAALQEMRSDAVRLLPSIVECQLTLSYEVKK